MKNQQKAIYDRSIAYIAALCNAIITIFLRYDQIFRLFVPNYNFKVYDDELLHIFFYTKWKLTEEELLLKDLEYMHLKDRCDLLELKLQQQQRQHLKSIYENNGKFNGKNIVAAESYTAAAVKQQNPDNSNHSSTLTISSLNELVDSSTMTTIYGNIDRPLKIDLNSDDRQQNDMQQQQTRIPMNQQSTDDDNQHFIHFPSGSYWNNVEIRPDLNPHHPLKTFMLEKDYQQPRKQTQIDLINEQSETSKLSDYPKHQSSSSSPSCIDRTSFDFDTSKMNVDRALKYGQNNLNQKSNDLSIDGNNQTQQNMNKSSKMDETNLARYLSKIPSADINRPSIAKTIRYDDIGKKLPEPEMHNNSSSRKNPFKPNMNAHNEDERNRILISRLL
ncbi:hypothetical protein BLA29_006602, partial [Euroglyphus maynei]